MKHFHISFYNEQNEIIRTAFVWGTYQKAVDVAVREVDFWEDIHHYKLKITE